MHHNSDRNMCCKGKVLSTTIKSKKQWSSLLIIISKIATWTSVKICLDCLEVQQLFQQLMQKHYQAYSQEFNKQRFKFLVNIVPVESLHQTIIAKINEVKNKRPIIVFFKGARELNEFSQSPWYENYLRRTSNLTEEHETAVRDSRIIRAVNADTITLMTNSFRRGTDFILLTKPSKKMEDCMSSKHFCPMMNQRRFKSRVEQPDNRILARTIASLMKIVLKDLALPLLISLKTPIQKPFIPFCARPDRTKLINCPKPSLDF